MLKLPLTLVSAMLAMLIFAPASHANNYSGNILCLASNPTAPVPANPLCDVSQRNRPIGKAKVSFTQSHLTGKLNIKLSGTFKSKLHTEVYLHHTVSISCYDKDGKFLKNFNKSKGKTIRVRKGTNRISQNWSIGVVSACGGIFGASYVAEHRGLELWKHKAWQQNNADSGLFART